MPRQHVTTIYLTPNTSNFSFIVAIYIQITQLSCNGASTHYIAVFCLILPYSTSYNILPNSASYILPSSTSYILPSSISHILPNSISHILPNSVSHILPNSISHILPNSVSYISALAALAASLTPF